MKTLHLNLKKEWFDMIVLGIKKEEYREIKEHWVSQFLFPTGGYIGTFSNNSSRSTFNYLTGKYRKRWIALIYGLESLCFKFNSFETITFSNGYAKDRPQFEIEFKGFEIREGKTEWGAEPNKKYFVLKLGEVISIGSKNHSFDISEFE